MSESVSRYPLEWPSGWVRIPAHNRVRADFSQTKHDLVSTAEGTKRVTRTTTVTVIVATRRLEDQLDRLGATNPVLSTNLSLRMDGRPRSDENPRDPGVAIYFRFKGKATVFACDKYLRVADNIAAIANHIDALRRIERYGVGSIEQALAGYKALPADTAADWRSVFGFDKSARVTHDELQTKYRERASIAHPDKGGTDDAMAHVNRARDYALAELTN
jgi:hypothetical protein